MDKLVALAEGLGVDPDELFHVARGLPEDEHKRSYTADALMILETVQKAVASPGEEAQDCSHSARTVSDEMSFDQGASPIREHSRSDFDFGTGALMLALALFVWTRLRA